MISGQTSPPREVHIVPFEPRFAAAFKALNEEWITRFFALEAADRKVLDAPEANIIASGGHILIARCGLGAVGACALLKVDADSYELAKMAVAPQYQGRGIGRQLGSAAISLARAHGARRLYLESNTILERAIALYRGLGFRERPARCSPYTRCNIHMEMEFPPDIANARSE